jgi:hypothetical protein
MQALDNFISTIPGFGSDISIPIVLDSTRPHGNESISDPSAGASASTSKTCARKQKATTNLTPQKKAKKAAGRSAGGIKINEPAPKAPTSTPLSGPQHGIPIRQSKMYTCHEYFSLPITL